MNKVKIAFSLLIAGSGALASAFTVKHSALATSGWYRPTTGIVTTGAPVVTTSFPQLIGTVAPTKGPGVNQCLLNASHICAAYFTVGNHNTVDPASGLNIVTGDFRAS